MSHSRNYDSVTGNYSQPYIEQLLFGTAFQYQKDDAFLVALKVPII